MSCDDDKADRYSHCSNLKEYQYEVPTKISDATKAKFVDVAVTNSVCAAIDEEGNIWTYGYNGVHEYSAGSQTFYNRGMLGNNNKTKPETLVQLTKITKDVVYKEIEAGEYHIIAKDEDNHLWAWGCNREGQLGIGNTTQYNVPTLITNKRAFKEIDINENLCIAIDINGDVYTWWENEKYQLGDGTRSDKTSISKIELDKKYKKCAISGTHSLILAEDGTLYGVGNGPAIGRNDESVTYIQITDPNSSYNVTFMDGGNTIDTQTVQEGQAATAPVLTKQGYSLSWDKDFSNITSDLIVNAIWTPDVYNVTLNTNVGGVTGAQIAEGKEITSYTYGIGANLPTLTEVSKAFYVFRGWYENENCEGTAVTRITETDTGAKTYYAKWLVDTDGDGIPDIEDDDIQVPYKIEHYKQKLDKTGYDLAETQTTIVVTNEETGAQETKTLTGNLGHEVTAVAKNYTGFRENQTAQGRVASGIVVIDGSLTLKLYYDRNSYKLPLDVNGTKEEIDYVYGEEVILPIDKQKPGYTFEGWYDNEDLTGEPIQKVDTSKIDPENPLTHYIKWTANTNTLYKVEYYIRTLDNEVVGYKLYETETLNGTTDTLATAIVKTYVGCTENITIVDRVQSGNINADGSLVLKLYYDRNIYKINYELNGGTTNNPLDNTYTYGEEMILSNRVQKEGHTFAGWYENEECTGEAITKIQNTQTGDKIYYAKWIKQQEIPFTISSQEYEISNLEKYISKVKPETTVQTFMNNISTNGTMRVVNSKGEEIQNEQPVGTGYKLKVEYKGTEYEYEVAVRGDIDGNGKITATDLSTLNQAVIKKITL